MEIYLIRHPVTVADKSLCFGQADVPADDNLFPETLSSIVAQLPAGVDAIYSSPLIRCARLARELAKTAYPSIPVHYDDRLKELNFGEWELQPWDRIPQEALNTWMNNFVTEKVPGGESNLDLHERAAQFWEELKARRQTSIVVTHAGVIRSFLSIVNGTDLQHAFTLYPVKHGGVIRV